MTHRLKTVLSLVLVLCMLLSGCVRTFYRPEQADMTAKAGRALLETWLETLPGRSEITDCSMMNASEEGMPLYTGKYASPVVSCRFTNGGKTYSAAADLTDGQIWSDYYMFDISAAVAGLLKPFFERCGYTGDYTVSGASLCWRLAFEGADGSPDTEIFLENMLPAEFSQPDEQARAEAVLSGAPLTGFTVSYRLEDTEYLPLAHDAVLAFLRESGNLLPEGSSRKKYSTRYTLESSSRFESVPESEASDTTWWLEEIDLEDGFEEGTFCLRRGSIASDGNLLLYYTGAEKSGSLRDFDSIPLEEHACPVEISGSTLRYYGAGTTMLRFREKPAYTEFIRTTYTSGKPDSPEALELVALEGGGWSLYSGRMIDKGGYMFTKEQDIEMR